MTPSTVYLVGAGPGDPALLTRRAAELLASADLILHDALVDPRVLALAPPSAELISVGKRAGGVRTEQSDINRLLVDYASAGRSVIRLKGGDPFLFGRGGEEALALAQVGIPFEVVPGITAAVAAGAYAGIPLTHRGLSSTCTFVTGHEDPAKPSSDVDWPALAASSATLCIYMGLTRLAALTRTLMDAGRLPHEPAALVASASLATQRTLTATLSTIADAADRADIHPPAILIVGPVVSLRQRLAWFESRPLFGKSILLTRPREDSAPLADALAGLGAHPILFPTIAIAPVDDLAPLDAALRELHTFDWTLFSSVHAVNVLFDRLSALDLDARAFGTCRIAAIGSATARALADHALIPDCVPPDFLAESLLETLTSRFDLLARRILFPRSDIARKTLSEGLTRVGAHLTELTLYHTLPAPYPPEAIDALLAHPPDVLTFTSASTVHNFISLLGPDRARSLARNALVTSIGPITSQALADHHLPVHTEAPVHTTQGLVNTILKHFGPHP